MSVEAAIYSILSSAPGVTSLVGGSRSPRIFPVAVPQGKPMPAIVYQQISSGDEITTGGHVGPRTDRFQITGWVANDDPEGARALAEAIRAAMAAASGSHGSVTVGFCSFDDEGDIYETPEAAEQLERFGKRQDWIVSYET